MLEELNYSIYWTQTMLVKRGWTAKTIDQILGEPDQLGRNPNRGANNRPSKGYAIPRVLDAEAASEMWKTTKRTVVSYPRRDAEARENAECSILSTKLNQVGSPWWNTGWGPGTLRFTRTRDDFEIECIISDTQPEVWNDTRTGIVSIASCGTDTGRSRYYWVRSVVEIPAILAQLGD